MALSSFQKAVNKGDLRGRDNARMVVQEVEGVLSFKREGRGEKMAADLAERAYRWPGGSLSKPQRKHLGVHSTSCQQEARHQVLMQGLRDGGKRQNAAF